MNEDEKKRAALALWNNADSLGRADALSAPPAAFLKQDITQKVQLKPLPPAGAVQKHAASISSPLSSPAPTVPLHKKQKEAILHLREDGTRAVHFKDVNNQRLPQPPALQQNDEVYIAAPTAAPNTPLTSSASVVSSSLADKVFKAKPKAATPTPNASVSNVLPTAKKDSNTTTVQGPYDPVEATISTLPSGVLKVQEWPYRPDRMQRPDGKQYSVDKKTGTKKRVYREEDRYSADWLKERVERIKAVQEDKMFGFMRMVAGFTNSDVDSEFLDDARGSRALAGAIRGQQQQQQQRVASNLITGLSSVTRMWSGLFSVDKLRDKLLTKISRQEAGMREKLRVDKALIDEASRQVWEEFIEDVKKQIEEYQQASDEDIASGDNTDVGPEPITGNTKAVLKENILKNFRVQEDLFNTFIGALNVSNGALLMLDPGQAFDRSRLQARVNTTLYQMFIGYCAQQLAILEEQVRELNVSEDEEDIEALDELNTDIARFKIAYMGKLPSNQVEKNAAYPSLKQLFEMNNNAPSEAQLRMWDIQHNNGELFAKIDRKAKRQAMQVTELEWIELPENLGYFFMKPIFEASLRRALRDVHDICGAQAVPYMDLMCHELVRTDFAELVAMHVLETRHDSPNRHQLASNRKHITQRMFLLKQKFKKLYYYGGYLAYRGVTNHVQVQQRRQSTLQRMQYTQRTGLHHTDMDLDSLPRSLGGSGRHAALGTTLSDMQFQADGGRLTQPRRLVNNPSLVSFEQFRAMGDDLPVNNRTRLAVQGDMEIAGAL